MKIENIKEFLSDFLSISISDFLRIGCRRRKSEIWKSGNFSGFPFEDLFCVGGGIPNLGIRVSFVQLASFIRFRHFLSREYSQTLSGPMSDHKDDHPKSSTDKKHYHQHRPSTFLSTVTFLRSIKKNSRSFHRSAADANEMLEKEVEKLNQN